MDENKVPQEQPVDRWLEDFLAAAADKPEIEADEQALATAGLTHPSDLELERIMQEVRSQAETESDAAQQPPAEEPAVEEIIPPVTEVEPFKDDEFRAAFGEGESLNEIFSDLPITPAQPKEPPAEQIKEEPPVEKGRPKRKKGYGLFGLPHLAATAVWLAIIVVIGVTVGRLVWLCASDILALGREPITAIVTIDEDDDMDAIAGKLKEAGLIQYPGIFKFYADITDAQEKIKPGTYTFSAVNEDNETIVYDYMALVSVMSPSGNRLVVVDDLRIPEGYSCAQIFKLLEEKKVCTVADMEAYVAGIDPTAEDANPLKEYWFLEGVEWGHKYSLEGYLFPDTYDFYENDDPKRVLEKMLDAFNVAFSDILRDKLQKVEGYTLREIMIIASMIEKESANNAESYTVSSVIYNRLENSANYPYLNIDATIVYALGGKSDLTAEDLTIDHPYNTYTNKGLPPGPISNPSQSSIAAAITPEDTDYYFYALDPSTKEHHFSKTYKEHQDFLNSLKEGK